MTVISTQVSQTPASYWHSAFQPRGSPEKNENIFENFEWQDRGYSILWSVTRNVYIVHQNSHYTKSFLFFRGLLQEMVSIHCPWVHQFLWSSDWIFIHRTVVTPSIAAAFVTNYKWCIFIFWCRAMRASKHAAYTSIGSQLTGWPSWAKYAAFRSATMVGMLHIEIPHISLFVCQNWNLHKSWNPMLNFETSCYSIYWILLLESCCCWALET